MNIRRVLRGVAGRTFGLVIDRVPTPSLRDAIGWLITRRALKLAPGDSLRFLFELDNTLYRLQGRQAVAYGKGTHTKHRHTRYHDFFVQRISSGQRVLDIGCGIGALAFAMADGSGAKITGIDINADNIAWAREHYRHANIEYQTGDVLQTPPSGDFDVVVLSNVLEHLPGRPGFLRRIDDLIHPTRFLIRVPLFERDWRVPLKRELEIEWRLDATHETEYTVESFAEEISAAGLMIVHQEIHWGEIWAEVTRDVEASRGAIFPGD